MKYRPFGKTDLNLSEIGFGAWAIGSKSFGHVDRQEALSALARAEELGCNFVDTAAVYGDSEQILGEFLQGRRDKWIIASKYSNQKTGMTALVEEQLKRMKLDVIDFYQIHWAPNEQRLYDELYQLKESGKVRYIGVSLYSALDIEYILEKTHLDGFQIDISLLTPNPFLRKLDKIRMHNPGIIARSCLHYGFLTGKYAPDAVFNDPDDQRSEWTQDRIKATAERALQFRFLQTAGSPLTIAAARYPLSFPEVSSVVMSTKNRQQAEINFKQVADAELSAEEVGIISQTQKQMGLFDRSMQSRIKESLSLLKLKYL